ncbi:hypothetical protein QR680_017398 [Steinernema hermaphroditum]|uniref:Uncharacterized protein n=1 Tax=Steinernema hermaphroditum TaxID=289476 RepID=A0AA39LP81_9BILA|nr:hypothetical protein QR680_017398 [Steinernema hermaphroditum]
MTVPTQTPYKFKLPHNLIQVVKNRSSVSFTTRSLIQYDDRIQQFLLQSGVVVDGLLTEIRTLIHSITILLHRGDFGM